jgi:hypothetical protein
MVMELNFSISEQADGLKCISGEMYHAAPGTHITKVTEMQRKPSCSYRQPYFASVNENVCLKLGDPLGVTDTPIFLICQAFWLFLAV